MFVKAIGVVVFVSSQLSRASLTCLFVCHIPDKYHLDRKPVEKSGISLIDISPCLCTVRHLLSEDEIPVPRGRPLCYGSPEISMYVPPRRAWPNV